MCRRVELGYGANVIGDLQNTNGSTWLYSESRLEVSDTLNTLLPGPILSTPGPVPSSSDVRCPMSDIRSPCGAN
jgi:hypothetical protein